MTEPDPPSPPRTPPGGGETQEPAGATAAGTSSVVPETGPGTQPIEGVAFAAPDTSAAPAAPAPAAPGGHPTAPVLGRPSVRPRRRGPLTRMGPWAPVAGATLGFLLAAVAVLLLAGTADGFRERLSLVLLVVGMGMLGASGPLLADEVRMVRRGAREAAVRPQWAEVTAGLLNGLTPARLLLLMSGFVLFLAAYVAR